MEDSGTALLIDGNDNRSISFLHNYVEDIKGAYDISMGTAWGLYFDCHGNYLAGEPPVPNAGNWVSTFNFNPNPNAFSPLYIWNNGNFVDTSLVCANPQVISIDCPVECPVNCLEPTIESIELRDKLISLETELQEMKRIINSLVDESHNISKEVVINKSARLDQNIPNPFKGTTKIKYFVPSNSQSAKIKIYDILGQLLNNIDVPNFGKGEIEVQNYKFKNGIYHYSLEVDGKIIDTKKMSSIK